VRADIPGVAFQPDEPRDSRKFPAKCTLHVGRRPRPGKPEHPLDLPALPGRGTARPPGQKGAGIAFVVADGFRCSRVELPAGLPRAVLAEVPFGPVPEVGRLERQDQGIRAFPIGRHRRIGHNGPPDRFGNGTGLGRRVVRYTLEGCALQGALDAGLRLAADTPERLLARRNDVGRALATVIQSALQVALEGGERRIPARIHPVSVSVQNNGIGGISWEKSRIVCQKSSQQTGGDISRQRSVKGHSGSMQRCRSRRSDERRGLRQVSRSRWLPIASGAAA
jgi:hypothetical protein